MQTLPQVHTSPETASIIDDYPYGFRLRCTMRVWLEYRKGHGYRMMSQTTNPKKPAQRVKCSACQGVGKSLILFEGTPQEKTYTCQTCHGATYTDVPVWNKPKSSTYSALMVLYLDDNGHIHQTGLHYPDSADIEAFAMQHAVALSGEREQAILKALRAVAAAQAKTRYNSTITIQGSTPVRVV